MIRRVTSLVIQRQDGWFVIRAGMVAIVLLSAFLKIVIGMGITIVTRSMEVRCVIVTGMELSALPSVLLKITRTGITSAIREMAARFAWITGMEPSANLFARQQTIQKDTTAVR